MIRPYIGDASRSTTGREKEGAHVRSKELWEELCPRDRDVFRD